VRVGAALAAVVAVGATSCGGAGDPAALGDPVATSDPASAFAPLVALHPREEDHPMSAGFFLDHATLEWAGGACALEVNLAAGRVAQRVTGEGAPRLDPRRLGDEHGYRHRPRRDDCSSRRAAVFATTQNSRPFATGRRPAGMTGDEGFYLDLLLEAYGGQRRELGRAGAAGRGVPAYFEQSPAEVEGEPGIRISYWLLFGRDDAVDGAGDRVAAHEGDWERVDVLAQRDGPGRYRPAGVRLGPRAPVVPWGDVELIGRARPILYAARGSHSLHTGAGRFRRRARSSYEGEEPRTVVDVTATCRDCPRWRTWQRLRPVREQPWYGYGGGWGVIGDNAQGSGPGGPSPFAR
jgi:hypothetical protein